MNTAADDSARTTDTRSAGLPRLIYLARILNLCFFPLATVILGNLVILYVSQAKEALRAFDDGRDDRWHVTPQSFSFVVAYTMWMMSAWYVARLLVGKRFDPDLVGACRSPIFATRVAKYLPRVLALAAGVPIAVSLLRTPQLLGLGVASSLICTAVYVGLVFRRSWARRNDQQWVARWHRKEFEDIERFDDLAGWAQVFIGVLFITSVGIAIALPIWMSPFARWIGAPALLLFALMSWTIFGGLVLTYWPKSGHFPAATWIVVVLVFFSWHWNENHLVAAPAAGIVNRARPELSAAFVDWLRHRPNPRAPVIFVSSSGGASRAAYWTTSALGKLEDEARGDSRTFADNIFVISGISGGSLGSAAFVTSLDLVRKSLPAGPCSKVRDVANSFTGLDHLSTVVGMMLFPDLVQRFIPKAFLSLDRSRGLEETWGRDWDGIMKKCGGPAANAPNPWEREFTLLYTAGGSGPRLPGLALSTTALGAGQAVFQNTFHMQRTDTFDILDERLVTKSLTLAQAVHNSARFPYISPGGMVKLARDGSTWDRLGDGGYVEASGALTLGQIIQALSDQKLIRADGTPATCDDPNTAGASPAGPVPTNGGDCYVLWDQVRILILDNGPTYGPNMLCGEAIAGDPSGKRQEQPQNNTSNAPESWPPGPDFVAPVLGSFSTRWGRGLSAQVDLRSLVGGCAQHFAELRLPSAPAGSQDPSMDWMLNAQSRSDMDSVLDGPTPGAKYPGRVNPQILLKQNMDIVRTWFYPAH